MLYIRLFHGRTNPEQDMDEWGSDGPVFGPYEFVHITHASCVRFGRQNGNCDSLYVYEDMLFYNGAYYGDWSVFTDETLKKGEFVTIPFEQSKANLPTQPS